jgi:hypothetical protein
VSTGRTQVNIRLERDLLDALDELASEESIDRAELARRLLRDGLKRERLARAMRRYRDGEASAARAAEEAGISLYEMLDRIRAEGIPWDPDSAELGRIDSMVGASRVAGVKEQATRYRAQQSDATSGLDELRAQFRPESVRWLFVGESSPAGGTHFYRANSNLFRAIRDAFACAFGDEVPAGDAFLHYFSRSAWLVDLADRPGLASTIRASQPARIFAVKKSIDTEVREAAAHADYGGDIVVLPFPVRQWRKVFIRKLCVELKR